MQLTKKRLELSKWVINLILLGLVIVSLYPFVFMILTSFTQKRIMSASFDFSAMDLRNYQNLFSNFALLTYVKNSLIVVSCACFFNVVIASLAGYAFAKKQFPLKETIFWLYLATLMMPGQVILIPVFTIMKELGLLNSYPALFLVILDAFGVFLMRQFMEGIPDELLEAARIDGCGELGIFGRVVLPLSRPVIVSLVVFTFITSWNDFIWPLILVTQDKMKTLTLALSMLQSNYGTNYGLVMAGATMAFLFPFVLYCFLQREFVEGIALSGIKG
ncbi:carbohydrate ABC transporter permease [Allofournierella sp.]|uniref:carbohydrate ABC transporter permease n=1 Tax=Allofournierella sp. TaxID=1940256 RepID=UPI003AB3E7E0